MLSGITRLASTFLAPARRPRVVASLAALAFSLPLVFQQVALNQLAYDTDEARQLIAAQNLVNGSGYTNLGVRTELSRRPDEEHLNGNVTLHFQHGEIVKVETTAVVKLANPKGKGP